MLEKTIQSKRLVGAMLEKRKKKKYTAQTPEFGEFYQYVLDTGTLPKMVCRCNLGIETHLGS